MHLVAVKMCGGPVAAQFSGPCKEDVLGGMILQISAFYHRHGLLFQPGMFYSAAPRSGAFGKLDWPRYDPWSWMFSTEGVITVLSGTSILSFVT